MNSEELKNIVKEKYGKIAGQSPDQSCCCGPSSSSCCGPDYTVFSESYETLEGYHAEG